METVPVLIITLCRYEHFKRCFESLKRNTLAQDTEVYVGLDYPLNEGHWKGYEKIKSYLTSNTEGFRKVHVVAGTNNLGSEENYQNVKQEIYKRFPYYIFTEDDNEFSPDFLSYMNQTMRQYENDDTIYAVSGYSYPIDLSDYHGNAFLLNTYFSAFGYGIWKEKEDKAYECITMSEFAAIYKKRKCMKELKEASKNQYCNFVKGMLCYIPELIKDNEIQRIDLSFGLYMFFHHKKMVFPTVSLVRNWGYDGSGIHCANIQQKHEKADDYHHYSYSEQKIDDKPIFGDLSFDLQYEDKELANKLNHFFLIQKKEEIRTVMAYYLSLLLGVNTLKKLILKLKK